MNFLLKITTFFLNGLAILVTFVHLAWASEVPAFPGAEGYGAISIGGRGGRVIEVTNLNNDGPGSFRAACAASGPRIVVFKVAGEIIIPGYDEIEIKNSYITIAGQTAPGDGITIRASSPNDGPLIEIVGANDVIIRYLKLRLGRGSENGDNLTIRDGERIIIDHVSAEWGSDENISCTPNSDGYEIRDISIQRSIIAETLAPHSTGSTNSRYGETNRIVDRVSYHYNVWAHNNHRNPRIASHMDATSGILSQIINNVVYNWKHRISEIKGRGKTDFFGNYYKAGPMSNLSNGILYEHLDGPDGPVLPTPSIFIAQNIMEPVFMSLGEDNWKLIHISYNGAGFNSGDILPKTWRRDSMHNGENAPFYPVTLLTPQEAYKSLVVNQDVGSNGRLDEYGIFIKNLDRVDIDVLNDVVNLTGPNLETEMDHQDDFGGYPNVEVGKPYIDSDHDGMPNSWEIKNNLNPHIDDSAEHNLHAHYTNIEIFINGIQKTKPVAPKNLRVILP